MRNREEVSFKHTQRLVRQQAHERTRVVGVPELEKRDTRLHKKEYSKKEEPKISQT